MSVLQTQKIECDPKRDPIDYFAKAVKRLRVKFVPQKEQKLYVSDIPLAIIAKLHSIKCGKTFVFYFYYFQKKTLTVEGALKRLALMHRESQQVGRRSIRKLRVFTATEYEWFNQEHQKLLDSRDIMDSSRHDVSYLKYTRVNILSILYRLGKIYRILAERYSHHWRSRNEGPYLWTVCLWIQRDCWSFGQDCGEHSQQQASAREADLGCK